MSMLDDILKGGGAKLTNLASFAAEHPQVVAAAASLLVHPSGANAPANTPAAATGGLGGLMAAFERGGLGNVMSSWISTGQNQPVAPGQLASALGPEVLEQFARKAGIDPSQASTALAAVLPLLVDHATPQGTVPPATGAGGLQDLLGAFLRR
jgi:uncharacterized protein YidB (DUF937 family)